MSSEWADILAGLALLRSPSKLRMMTIAEKCRRWGLVDYDLDLDVANNPGFAISLKEASKTATKSGTDIHGGAVAAFLSKYMQTFVRSIQIK